MARILSTARCQLRLLFRSPLFLAVAFGILVVVTVAAVDCTDGLPTPPSEAMAVAVGQMLPLGLLVLTLLASAAGVSSRSGRAAEMTDTYWHSNAEMAAGHTLGLAAAFVAVQTIAMVWVILVVWTLYGRLPVDLTATLELWLSRVAPSAIQTAGVGYFIGLGLGSPVAAYPVAAGAWFLGVMGSMQATVLPATRWLCILDVGTGQEFDQPMTARIVAALGLLAAGLAAATVKRRRESARSARAGAVVWLLAAAVLFAGAMVDDWRVWSFRRGMSDLFVAAASADDEALAQAPAAELALRPATDVLSYDMDLHVDPREKSIANTVTMQVANSGPEPIDWLTFTLRGSVFGVEDCRIETADAPWSPAKFEQKASLMQVLLPRPLEPGASCSVRVSYRGLVQDWTLGRFRQYGTELNAIVMPRYTWIPSGVGWYPVGGARATRFVALASGLAAASAERLQKFSKGKSALKAVWLENSHPAVPMHVVVHIDDFRLAAGADMGIPGRLISGPSESLVYEFESESARDLYLAVDRFCLGDARLSDSGRDYLDRRWLFYEQLSPSGVEMRVVQLPKLGPRSSSPRLAPTGIVAVSDSSELKAVEKLARKVEPQQKDGILSSPSSSGSAVTVANSDGEIERIEAEQQHKDVLYMSYDRKLVENAVLDAWWPSGGTREGMHGMVTMTTELPGATAGEESRSAYGDLGPLDDCTNVIEGLKRYALSMFLESDGQGALAQQVRGQAPTPRSVYIGADTLRIGAATRQAMSMIHAARQDYGDDVVRGAYRVLRAGRPGRDGIVTLADLASALRQAAEEAGSDR